MSGHPAIATFAAFARILGVTRAWVTALRQAGRLVLTPDGKLVMVAESIARIEATRDPAKDAVAARHAARRATQGGQGAPLPHAAASAPAGASAGAQGGHAPLRPTAPVVATPTPGHDEESEEVDDPIAANGPETDSAAPPPKRTSGRAYWSGKREEELYRQIARENAVAEGKLLDRSRVIQACDVAIATLNSRLSAWREQLAPQIPAIRDEQAARALLDEASQQMSEQFARDLGKAVEQNS